MTPNPVLELSIEQLIGALNEKLSIECTRLPLVSRTHVATLRVEVDALEKRVKKILHKVICLKNPLQLANRLPPEIIAVCASFVVSTKPKPILSLTHVCQYWRKAIISSPRNWAFICSGWGRLVPLCLERAGEAPLTVDISVSESWSGSGLLRFVPVLAPHVSRISSLSISGCQTFSRMPDSLIDFFAPPMSNLISLDLKEISSAGEFFPSNDIPAPPLFQDVSKLKSLHLTRVPIYPVLYNIPSLVELELVGYTIPFGKFIGFLDSNATLESIALSLGFVKASVWTVPERMVSLPRLRRFVLTCDATGSRGLFSCLCLPRGIKIEVHESEGNSCWDLASFLPHPPTPIQDLLAPITTIKYRHSPKQYNLSNNNSSFSFHRRITESKISVELNLFATGAVREFHLDLKFISEDLATRLPRLLKRLPALEALVISRASLYPRSLSALTEVPVLCPSLKTIAFFDCRVGGHIITELKEIQAKREYLAAARLHRVVIIDQVFSPPLCDSIKELRKFVPRVEVMVSNELPDLS